MDVSEVQHTISAPLTTGNQDKPNSNDDAIQPGTPKVSSMVIYLPKDNQNTGQLDSVTAMMYSNSSLERVFIAPESSSNSGVSVLGELPGFFKARDLIPSFIHFLVLLLLQN